MERIDNAVSDFCSDPSLTSMRHYVVMTSLSIPANAGVIREGSYCKESNGKGFGHRFVKPWVEMFPLSLRSCVSDSS
jgi:hypothetical protein